MEPYSDHTCRVTKAHSNLHALNPGTFVLKHVSAKKPSKTLETQPLTLLTVGYEL